MQSTLNEKIMHYAKDQESAEALQALFSEVVNQPEILTTVNFEELWEILSEGVVIHDMSGAIVRANASAEKVLGLTFAQMTGRTSIDPRWRAIHPDGSPFPGETHPAMITLATGIPQNDTIMGIYQSDESLTWIKINTRPIHTPDKRQQIGVVAAFQDITEIYQNAQRFDHRLEEERSRILSAFLRDATHEFRTPLSTIKTKAYILEKKYGDLLDHPHEFQDIQDRVEDITRLVNDLTVMTELDEVNYWAMDVFDYYPIIKGLIESYDEYNTHNISLQTDCDQHVIFANPRLFTIALRQIMDNAFAFTPNDGLIRVTLRHEGNYHLIEVADEGIGMTPDVLDHALCRFYRMDDAHTRRGFGLGLPIVKRICEIHSSQLNIESVPDKGTQVTLCFVAGDASRL